MNVNSRDYYKKQIIKIINQIEDYERMVKIHAFVSTHLELQEEKKCGSSDGVQRGCEDE